MSNPGFDNNKNFKLDNKWLASTYLRNTEDKLNNKEDNTKMSFSVDTFNTNVISKIPKNINSGESNLKTTEVINSEVINKSNNINLNNLSPTLNLPNHNRIDISIKINEGIYSYIIPQQWSNTKNKNPSYIVSNNHNYFIKSTETQIKPAITYYDDYPYDRPVVVGSADIIVNPLNIKNNIEENSKLNNTIKINKNKNSNNFRNLKIFNKIKAKKDSETSVISLYVGNKVISLVLKFIPNKKINKIKQDK